MNNTNNQNPAQKRKIESALASSAMQAMQQPVQATASNFKAARENQANYMKSFVPVDQKLPTENLFSKQGAPA